MVQFPTWCFGPPAMLKGYFDRLMMPGVVDRPQPTPPTSSRCSTHIRKIVGISTYGRPRWMALYMRDPPRVMVKRYLKRLTGGEARRRNTTRSIT